VTEAEGAGLLVKVEVQYLDVAALVPYVRNPRKHSRGALLFLRKRVLVVRSVPFAVGTPSARGGPQWLAETARDLQRLRTTDVGLGSLRRAAAPPERRPDDPVSSCRGVVKQLCDFVQTCSVPASFV
jgi:hypothetical protein